MCYFLTFILKLYDIFIDSIVWRVDKLAGTKHRPTHPTSYPAVVLFSKVWTVAYANKSFNSIFTTVSVMSLRSACHNLYHALFVCMLGNLYIDKVTGSGTLVSV